MENTMKVKTYAFPQCKEKISPNELIRSTHTFYTRTLNGVKNSEHSWIAEEIKITDGLEVLMDIETFYENKFSLTNREMFFGEFPENATSENLELELLEFKGTIHKFRCECILREYTCKIEDYGNWKKKLDIYDVWRILDLEEKNGL